MMPHAYPLGAGWIEVITGCMFSGKTEELLRRVRRARIGRQRVVIFKPESDQRHAADAVVAHSESRQDCTSVARATDILTLAGDADVVGIDEAQFLGPDLPMVVTKLADEGRRVIVAGLDQDYRGRPFEPMPELLAIADVITKNHAVCTICGAPASRTQRLVRGDALVLLGAEEAYEARCRRHWNPDRFDAEQERLPLTGGS
jgi:thymidine kinase